jgi:hypothetical protein
MVWAIFSLFTPSPQPPLLGRACLTLLFSDFVEEKAEELVRKM